MFATAHEDTRGMTVHFMDGSRMRFAAPKQAKDDWDAIRKTQNDPGTSLSVS